MKQSESIEKLSAALCKAQSVGWWQMPGFSKYLIGDAGEVFTLRGKGRVMRPSRAGDRYHKVVLVADDGTYQTSYVHQLMARCFDRDRKPGEHVRHLDGDAQNNDVTNIAYGTPSENYADKVRHGRDSSGERNGMSKLTASQVKQIRSILGSKHQKQIASDFGVSPMTISRIANNKLWRNV